jgi:hypothetical protein
MPTNSRWVGRSRGAAGWMEPDLCRDPDCYTGTVACGHLVDSRAEKRLRTWKRPSGLLPNRGVVSELGGGVVPNYCNHITTLTRL